MKKRISYYAVVRRYDNIVFRMDTGPGGKEALAGETGEAKGRLAFSCLFIYSSVCH